MKILKTNFASGKKKKKKAIVNKLLLKFYKIFFNLCK